MENTLAITVSKMEINETNNRVEQAEVVYCLTTVFNPDNYLLVGRIDKPIYTLLGSIAWETLLGTVVDILKTYSECPKLGINFIDSIDLSIQFADNQTKEELQQSFANCKQMIGSERMLELKNQILFYCKTYKFKPFINGVDFAEIIIV